ncbi:MAG TPA: hypothetical protein V6C76_15160 [Drouetiella sp.]
MLSVQSTAKSFSRFEFIAGAAIIIALILFYFPFLSGQQSFFYTDTTFGLEPTCTFRHKELTGGHFPLWNPLLYCGMSELAVPFPSLFYPPDYLLVVLPFNQGLALAMIFHQVLAAVSMFLLLKRWGLEKYSATTGGVIYSMSGYMFSLTANYSLVAGAAWLPLCMFTLSNFQSVKDFENYKWCLLSSFSLAMLVLSGRPEVFVPSLAVIVAYVLSFRDKENSFAYVLSWQIRSFLLAFLFSAPAIFPTAEWLSQSRRATGMLGEEVFMFSANWYDVVSIFWGQGLGNLRAIGTPFRSLVLENNFPPFMSCAYVGPVSLVLACIGAFAKWKYRAFTIAVLVLGLAFGLGKNLTLVSWVISVVPGLNFVRIPIKLFFLVTWALSITAAYGVAALENERAIRWGALTTCISLIASLLLIYFTSASVAVLPFMPTQAQAILLLRSKELHNRVF